MSLTVYDPVRNCFILKPVVDVCPSPFDYKAYMDWQKRHGNDPWKEIKRNAIQTANTAPISETKRDLKPKEFFVYAKAKVQK